MGVRDGQIRVPVPEPPRDDSAAGDDPEAVVAVRSAERPPRDPVDAAHVTREQRGNEHEPPLARQIRDRDQPLEHHRVNPVSGGLEVLPDQKHPDRVETAGGYPREVCCDLSPIEFRPPAHRRTRRPVIDTYPEAIFR